MTANVLPLSYAGGPRAHNCPLCAQRPASPKAIYGHPVCKKCFYKFANRRQLGYLIDVILYTIPVYFLGMAMGSWMFSMGFREVRILAASTALGALLFCVFIMKDGFNGQSPGKRATGIRVIDERTGQPIGFRQSFKRNSILLFGVLPFVGGLVQLVLIIIIAVQVAKGYRLGDRFAETKAIWRRYEQLPVFGGNAVRCENCSYDLTANASGICPECGTPLSPMNAARLNPPRVGAI